MTDEELIKWFKKYTAITKKDNEIAETVGLEVNVEISVEMAERLINLIEKQQKEIEEKRINYYKVNSKIENTYWKTKIRDKIKELEREKRILEDNKMKDKMVYTPYQIVNAEILRLKELLGE